MSTYRALLQEAKGRSHTPFQSSTAKQAAAMYRYVSVEAEKRVQSPCHALPYTEIRKLVLRGLAPMYEWISGSGTAKEHRQKSVAIQYRTLTYISLQGKLFNTERDIV